MKETNQDSKIYNCKRQIQKKSIVVQLTRRVNNNQNTACVHVMSIIYIDKYSVQWIPIP